MLALRATTSQTSTFTPAAAAPSAIPCISCRYSASTRGQKTVSAVFRKKAQSRLPSWVSESFATARASAISGARSLPCW